MTLVKVNAGLRVEAAEGGEENRLDLENLRNSEASVYFHSFICNVSNLSFTGKIEF